MQSSQDIAAANLSHSHPKRLGYLDGWRGLSIITVLVGHFTHLEIARAGVDMFFVLSGRLMAEILFVEKMPLLEFYRRRLSRIYPALLIFVLVMVAVFHSGPFAFGPKRALAALLLVYNYVAALGYRAVMLDHVWSLCVEEHAYIILGCLAFFARRMRLPVVIALSAGAALSMVDGLLSQYWLHQDWYANYWRTDAHLTSILASAAIFLQLRHRRMPHWLGPLCALLGILVFYTWPQSYVFGALLFAVAINSLDSSPQWLKTALSSKPLVFIGALSYSLYLWQQPFYRLMIDHGSYNKAPILIAIIAATALVSYYVIERPARRFLNGLSLPFNVAGRFAIKPRAPVQP